MKTPNVEKELIQLENEYWQAIKDRNFDAALRLTDDPCIVTGAQGVGRIDREQFLGMMEASNYELKDFRVTNPQVRMLGDDLAIVAYTVHEDLTVEGRPVSLDAADASTWIRKPEGWVCALHTESLLGDPFGRARRKT